MTDRELIATLSGKQLDTLKLLSEGKTTKEVARAQNCRADTVKRHLSATFRKLGVNNRVHAVVIYLRDKYTAELDRNALVKEIIDLRKEVTRLSTQIPKG